MAEGYEPKPFDISEVTPYLPLGSISGADDREGMINAYKALSSNIQGKTVFGEFSKGGVWFYIGYVYLAGFGDYGMMLAGRYNGTLYYLINVGGTYTVYNISKSVI